MLATLVNQAFDDANWYYEIKWDGYRALALMNDGKVDLKSRNDKSFNEKFYPLVNALAALGVDAVMDGEVIVTTKAGRSDFGALQNWRSEADGELRYYVFDLLWLDGRDLTQLPLSERRQLLRSILPKTSPVHLSENFDGSGKEAFNTAKRMGLEGLIAKKKDSVYQPGKRSKDWVKIKAHKRQEVVIGGFTRNEGSDKPFSSLLVGVFAGGKLHFTGKIGTGFSIKMQRELLKQFEPLIRSRSPFVTIPDINSPSRFRPNPPQATATWLKPTLVSEVSFTEMTTDGVMRHPSFEGMRIDKDPMSVVLEEEVNIDAITAEHENLAAKSIITLDEKVERRSLVNPTNESQERKIDGHDLKLNNLSKIYWPEDGLTKRDMLNYYYQVAPYILPYLKDRPQELNRHPNGIHGKHFYQKDVKGKVPEWIHTFRYYSEADQREKEFFICDNEASLIYLASQGSIEISTWNSRAKKPDYPDWCVIDLDPDQNTFEQVIKTAQVTHEVFDMLGIPSYCKTSGSTGLHIYVPLGAKYTYEQSREFARLIATFVHSHFPQFTSIERQVADRGGKMYIDFLQNRPQATLVAPYSLRPKMGAPVSMPLHWDEVKTGLRIEDFTMQNALARLKQEGNIFIPATGKSFYLPKAMEMLRLIGER